MNEKVNASDFADILFNTLQPTERRSTGAWALAHSILWAVCIVACAFAIMVGSLEAVIWAARCIGER